MSEQKGGERVRVEALGYQFARLRTFFGSRKAKEDMSDSEKAFKEMVDFLYGAGPLEGVWFGDKHPTEQGTFWWRKHLRRIADELEKKQEDVKLN